MASKACDNHTVADIISHAGGPQRGLVEELEAARPVRRLEGRNWSKADLCFYDLGGVKVAVKSYAPRGLLLRNTLGRWLIRREAAAYRAAEGVPGLPECHGRSGPFALVTEWVPGRPLRELPAERVEPALFDRLAAIVDELHRREVALGDLHHRDVLVGENGALWVVDLATALVLGERPSLPRRALFERLREADRVNLARMRARFTGGDAAAAVASVSPRAAAWHRRGRRFKSVLDGLRGRRRR